MGQQMIVAEEEELVLLPGTISGLSLLRREQGLTMLWILYQLSYLFVETPSVLREINAFRRCMWRLITMKFSYSGNQVPNDLCVSYFMRGSRISLFFPGILSFSMSVDR